LKFPALNLALRPVQRDATLHHEQLQAQTPRDPNQLGKLIVGIATGEAEKS
jgi:hypothetical protein